LPECGFNGTPSLRGLHDRDAIRVEGVLCGDCHSLDGGDEGAKRCRIGVQNVAGSGLRNHQDMAFRLRHDIHERKDIVVLIDLVGGNFAAQNLGKDIVGVIGGVDHLRLSSKKPVCLIIDILPLAFAERAMFGEDIAHLLDILPLALEVVGNSTFQSRMGDEMRRMRCRR
jgi:hypothetical protein